MEPDKVKTPAELAEDARQTGREALEAAHGFAQEGTQIGNDTAQSIRSNLEDAKAIGLQAADTVAGLASDMRGIARDAADTGKAYVKGAVNATGQKMRDLKSKATQVRADAEQYIADQPVRSMLVAAAGGAVAMALLLLLLRESRRY